MRKTKIFGVFCLFSETFFRRRRLQKKFRTLLLSRKRRAFFARRRLDKTALFAPSLRTVEKLAFSAAAKTAMQCTAKEKARPNALWARSGFAPEGFFREFCPRRAVRGLRSPLSATQKGLALASLRHTFCIFCISGNAAVFLFAKRFCPFFMFFCNPREPHQPACFANCHAGSAACQMLFSRGFFPRLLRSRARRTLPEGIAPRHPPAGARLFQTGL